MSEDTINDRTLTTFYLPPGTEKALHITSQTTTQVSPWKYLLIKSIVACFHCADVAWHHFIIIIHHKDVVRVLLKKFRVADSPHKYALYERNLDDIRRDRWHVTKVWKLILTKLLQFSQVKISVEIKTASPEWGREASDAGCALDEGPWLQQEVRPPGEWPRGDSVGPVQSSRTEKLSVNIGPRGGLV